MWRKEMQVQRTECAKVLRWEQGRYTQETKGKSVQLKKLARSVGNEDREIGRSQTTDNLTGQDENRNVLFCVQWGILSISERVMWSELCHKILREKRLPELQSYRPPALWGMGRIQHLLYQGKSGNLSLRCPNWPAWGSQTSARCHSGKG